MSVTVTCFSIRSLINDTLWLRILNFIVCILSHGYKFILTAICPFSKYTIRENTSSCQSEFDNISHWASDKNLRWNQKKTLEIIFSARGNRSSLLHSVNLILFTLLLVHLILRISPHHSHHLRSHHLSLPLPFTPDLKLISFTNPFLHSHSYSFRTAFMDLNLYWIKGALLFVLVSGYVC